MCYLLRLLLTMLKFSLLLTMFPGSVAALVSFSHLWKNEDGTIAEARLHTGKSKLIGVTDKASVDES